LAIVEAADRPKFQFPNRNSGRSEPGSPCAVGPASRSFNSPIGIRVVQRKRRPRPASTSPRFNSPIGIRVVQSRVVAAAASDSSQGFNSPIGIRVVQSPWSPAWSPLWPRFNSPIGIRVVQSASPPRAGRAKDLFQFPNRNSGRSEVGRQPVYLVPGLGFNSPIGIRVVQRRVVVSAGLSEQLRFNSPIGIRVVQSGTRLAQAEFKLGFNSPIGIRVVQSRAAGTARADLRPFQFPNRNSGRSEGSGADHPARQNQEFQFPNRNSGRSESADHGVIVGGYRVSIPQSEFGSFRGRSQSPPRDGTCGFNSPIGIRVVQRAANGAVASG